MLDLNYFLQVCKVNTDLKLFLFYYIVLWEAAGCADVDMNFMNLWINTWPATRAWFTGGGFVPITLSLQWNVPAACFEVTVSWVPVCLQCVLPPGEQTTSWSWTPTWTPRTGSLGAPSGRRRKSPGSHSVGHAHTHRVMLLKQQWEKHRLHEHLNSLTELCVQSWSFFFFKATVTN